MLQSGLDLPIDQLHSILNGIITGILKNSHVKMRENLYCTLNFYLAFTKQDLLLPPNLQEDLMVQILNHLPVLIFIKQWRVREIHSQQTQLEEGNFQLLENPGERLVHVICQDVTEVNHLSKSLVNHFHSRNELNK